MRHSSTEAAYITAICWFQAEVCTESAPAAAASAAFWARICQRSTSPYCKRGERQHERRAQAHGPDRQRLPARAQRQHAGFRYSGLKG